jgi:hypothetical protein
MRNLSEMARRLGGECRHQAGGDRHQQQRRRAQPDDRREAVAVCRLSRGERSHDKCGRARASHPSIFKGLLVRPWSGVSERQGVGQRNERRERRGLQQADRHDHPKSMGRQIKQRGACGQNGAHGELRAQEMETIGQTPRDRTAHEPQRGCRAQYDAELLGLKPAFGQKGGQERRRKSERTEQRGIERDEAEEHAAPSRDRTPVHREASPSMKP